MIKIEKEIREMTKREETKQMINAEFDPKSPVKSITVKNPAGDIKTVYVLRNGNMDDSIRNGGQPVTEATFKEMILAAGFEIVKEVI